MPNGSKETNKTSDMLIQSPLIVTLASLHDLHQSNHILEENGMKTKNGPKHFVLTAALSAVCMARHSILVRSKKAS